VGKGCRRGAACVVVCVAQRRRARLRCPLFPQLMFGVGLTWAFLLMAISSVYVTVFRVDITFFLLTMAGDLIISLGSSLVFMLFYCRSCYYIPRLFFLFLFLFIARRVW